MLRNIGISEFKTLIGAASIDVLRNPKTGKLFASASNGDNFKVEANIDLSKPVVFLMEDGDTDSACLINRRDTVEKLGTL